MDATLSRLDPHSYADENQPRIVFLNWNARIDFVERRIFAEATLTFENRTTSPTVLDLDTRDLTIESVCDESGATLRFVLHSSEPILGARLEVALPTPTREVHIRYQTSQSASALQWLVPAQTFDGTHPFLFSQCQAIHARSVVPLQDTPRHRIRYRAELRVPAELKGLMAARQIDRRQEGAVAVERFEMPEAIPPYLIALAVGRLESRDVGPRSRVWAEPSMVEKSAYEFVDVDKMLHVGEDLFGLYEWERFDLLVMPRSFPYGGMENPRLTFLTPTLVAGDRSLVSVVAHELAHSWTGNLVTNADAEHFWLNEGFTVYAERRIVEAIYGEERAALDAALGFRDLEAAVKRFANQPELTKLRTHLQGIDPDESFSEIPYEKGFLLLRTLEQVTGRPEFTRFLRSYIAKFRFQSITTEQFVVFAESQLDSALDRVGIDRWLHEPGIPEVAEGPRSARLDLILKNAGQILPEAVGRSFSATEWQLYLESIRIPAPVVFLEEMDRVFQLSQSHNFEIIVSWLTLGIKSGYLPAIERTLSLLGEVGRMKYLKSLYGALLNYGQVDIARSAFATYSAGYHPIAQAVVKSLLASLS
jgi:leukotriene-A4 hydrolase